MEETAKSLHHQKLEGKVAIITGGASGIGEATAHLFAEHGAHAIVIADILDILGQNVAKSIGDGRCTYMHCDVTDEDQVKALVESTVKIFGKLDIMFSNAGVVSEGNQTILDFDLDASDRVFAINTRGNAACVKHAARAMVEGGMKGGSIVCTGSVASEVGMGQFIDYVMSKHAVLGLVRSASKGLAEYGIRVNCVSPGGVPTPLACYNVHKFASLEEGEKYFESKIKLQGCGAIKVKDIANTILFLASQDSQFVTGQNLVVDGGKHY